MMDLRAFVENMEERHPGEILRVSRQVDPKFEISSVIRRLQEDQKFPAVLFENVKGSDHPVLTNVHATRERMAYGMGVDAKSLEQWARKTNRACSSGHGAGKRSDLAG